MAKNLFIPILLSALFLLTAGSAHAQTANLLKNSGADEGARHWRAFGKATIDEAAGSFTVRDGGYFVQDVTLPGGMAGHYAVLIGRAASERIEPHGAVTGLPYLYGYMMNAGDPSGGRIYAYLQGQRMLSSAKAENEWVYLWGIFQVPIGTERVRFFLKQAERKGVPHNDSAARFDDLGLHLFPTPEEARAFVESTTMSVAPIPTPAGQRLPAGPQCTLAQAPEIYGFRLGMSVEDVLALFPGSDGDAAVRRAVERSRAAERAVPTWLIIDPHKYSVGHRHKEVNKFALRVMDGKVLSIQVDFTGSQWGGVDEFISRHAAGMNLPAPGAWERVGGLGATSKYIICDGVEIRFYVAPRGSHNHDYISVVDTEKEKTPGER